MFTLRLLLLSWAFYGKVWALGAKVLAVTMGGSMSLKGRV